MKRKYLLSILLTLHAALSPTGAWADDKHSCPWLFGHYLTPKQKREIDPADYKAIEDLLKNVYRKPEQSLSADAQAWVDEFQLQAIVAEVREKGLETLRISRQQKRNRRAAAATGATLIGGYLTSRFTTAIDKAIRLEERLNEEFGLNLQGNSDSQLLFLEAMINCNPVPKERRIPVPLQKQLRKYSSVNQVAAHLLFGEKAEKTSRVGLVDAESEQLAQGTEEAFRLWLKYKISLCSRWTAPSEMLYSPRLVSSISRLIQSIPPEFSPALRQLGGVILTSDQFKDPSFRPQHEGQVLEGIYRGGPKRIEIYTYSKSSFRAADTFIHELAHHLSQEDRIGFSGEWRRLYRRSAEGEHAWLPSDYAKTSPEEGFAEAVACFLNRPECKVEMEKRQPEMYQFVAKLFRFKPLTE